MSNKKKYSSNNTQRTLEEILDSDDELSVDYDEAPYTPAYQDDARFDNHREMNNTQPTKNESDEETVLRKQYVTLAIFNKRDTLCLQYVQKEARDTVDWFFEFLIHQDLQSNYRFLKSCLVPKYEHYYPKFLPETVNVRKPKSLFRYNVVIAK